MDAILRPNDKREKNIITVIWIFVSVHILYLILNIFLYDLVLDVKNLKTTSQERLDLLAGMETIMVFPVFIVIILFYVYFIMWFRRSYYNLHQIIPYLRYKDGWAAGAWFVPILNLYRPYRIMKELVNESEEFIQKRDEYYTVNLNKYLGITWWMLWISSNTISRSVNRINEIHDTVSGLLAVYAIEVISTLLLIAFAFVTVKIIREYSSMDKLIREILVQEGQNKTQEEFVD